MCFLVKIRIGSWEQTIEAFLDTGNGLRDPVSGKSVAVASSLLWQKLKEEGVITADRFRMIPYSAVGGSGLLPAVRTGFSWNSPTLAAVVLFWREQEKS